MFRHQGKSRTASHNLQLAVVLSFVAGVVNVAGFLAFNELTTNVTGHFAQFIQEVSNVNVWRGTVYLLYILAFLAGSFSAGVLVNYSRSTQKLNIFLLPSLIEFVLLLLVGFAQELGLVAHPHSLACILLFAMGLQNAYVTKISDAVVRTTHLTGLFTDLGIELSQLLTKQDIETQHHLKTTIKLRLFIITFFFFGGLAGGFFFSEVALRLHTVLFAAFILLLSLFYDDYRYRRREKL